MSGERPRAEDQLPLLPRVLKKGKGPKRVDLAPDGVPDSPEVRITCSLFRSILFTHVDLESHYCMRQWRLAWGCCDGCVLCGELAPLEPTELAVPCFVRLVRYILRLLERVTMMMCLLCVVLSVLEVVQRDQRLTSERRSICHSSLGFHKQPRFTNNEDAKVADADLGRGNNVRPMFYRKHQKSAHRHCDITGLDPCELSSASKPPRYAHRHSCHH